MTGMPREVPKPRTAFGRNFGGLSTRSRRAPEPGRAMVVARAGTYFRDTPSASFTSCAVMPSRLSRWLMVVGGPGTGGRASDKPSNFRMQLTALRAAADTAR